MENAQTPIRAQEPSNVKTQEEGHYRANRTEASTRHKIFDIGGLLIYRCNRSFRKIIHFKHISTENRPAYTCQKQKKKQNLWYRHITTAKKDP